MCKLIATCICEHGVSDAFAKQMKFASKDIGTLNDIFFILFEFVSRSLELNLKFENSLAILGQVSLRRHLQTPPTEIPLFADGWKLCVQLGC